MNVRTIILEILTILSSFSTLICCALPAALVTIGAVGLPQSQRAMSR